VALNTIPYIPADGQIVVTDGAALSYTIAYEEGDFSISGMKDGDASTELFSDRGDFFAARQVQQEAVSVSFSCMATEFYDGTDDTFLDAFLKTGAWGSATSVVGTGDVHAVKVVLTCDTSGITGGSSGTLAINHFIPDDVSFSGGRPWEVQCFGSRDPVRRHCGSYPHLTATRRRARWKT